MFKQCFLDLTRYSWNSGISPGGSSEIKSPKTYHVIRDTLVSSESSSYSLSQASIHEKRRNKSYVQVKVPYVALPETSQNQHLAKNPEHQWYRCEIHASSAKTPCAAVENAPVCRRWPLTCSVVGLFRPPAAVFPRYREEELCPCPSHTALPVALPRRRPTPSTRCCRESRRRH